jgi:hypothetical protein
MKKYNIEKAIVIVLVICFIGTASASITNDIPTKESDKIHVDKLQIWTQTSTFSEPTIYEQKNSVSIKIDDVDTYTQIPEQPRIPYRTVVRTFPIGTQIHDISCTYPEPEQLILTKPIECAPQINWYISTNNPNDALITMPDKNMLPWYTYHLGGGLYKGKHVTFLSIHIYPIYYNKDCMILEFIDNITISVQYELPTKQPTNQDAYDFVIISPPQFQSPVQKLVTHKTGNGISTKLVTLDEIYNGDYFPVKGYDDAEQIKYFIKNAFEQWGSTYFLLVGSIYKLPIRSAWFGDWGLLTDMYYADLYFGNGSFCTWDSNKNHIYGEYWHQDEKDIVDLYADVYLGRIACTNLFEVHIVVDKIIKYESKSHDAWWNKIILLGGDTFPGWGVIEGEVTNECIAEALPDFNHIKCWTSENTFKPKRINKEVNKGARFLEYSGHGYQYGMGTSPPNEEKRISYTTLDLLQVFNGYKLPVIFFDACLTAKLDYTLGEAIGLSRLIRIPFPVYAWYWVKKIGGGAIATIGATEVAYSSVNAQGPQAGAGCLSLFFFEGFNSCDTVAEMLVYAQNYYLNNLWKDHWTIEQFILLGDPTLMVGGSSE